MSSKEKGLAGGAPARPVVDADNKRTVTNENTKASSEACQADFALKSQKNIEAGQALTAGSGNNAARPNSKNHEERADG